MSIVWQADVFCDGEDCTEFVEQGETYWNSTKGVSVGAWEVAQARNWTRKRTGTGSLEHFCPACSEQQRSN